METRNEDAELDDQYPVLHPQTRVVSLRRDEDLVARGRNELVVTPQQGVIASALDGSRSVGDVVDVLVEKYDRPREEVRSDVRNLVESLRDENLAVLLDRQVDLEIYRDGDETSGFQPRAELVELSLELVDGCPYDCSYCLGDFTGHVEEKLPTEETKALFREARELGATNLGLIGGDPLLHPDFVELVDYATELGLETSTSTKGQLVDGELLADLERAGLNQLQISIDAWGSDKYAEMVGVEGVYDRVINALFEAESRSFDVRANVTVTSDNVDEIASLRDELETFDLDASVNFVLPMGSASPHVCPTAEEMSEVTATMSACENYDGRMNDPVIRKRGRPCGGGTHRLHVRADGMATICDKTGGLGEKFELGDVFEMPLEDILYSDKLRELEAERANNPTCRECDLRAGCKGGCAVFADIAYDDPMASDPICARANDLDAEPGERVSWVDLVENA